MRSGVVSISSNKCVFVLHYTVEILARKEEIQADRERESPMVRRSEYDNFNEN